MHPPDSGLSAAGIILAAGPGTRMGRNKMRLTLNGEPLVRRIAHAAMLGGVDPLVVVLGYEADEVAEDVGSLGCQILVNPDYEGPESTSLQLALNHLPQKTEAAVVLLGDMPYTTGYMVHKVIEIAATDGVPLVVSRYGRTVGPPVLFRRELFPELLATTGDGYGGAVIRAHADDAFFVDWPAAYGRDIDTPADYERARQWIREMSAGSGGDGS